jgi:TrmH RNA methyltransferase
MKKHTELRKKASVRSTRRNGRKSTAPHKSRPMHGVPPGDNSSRDFGKFYGVQACLAIFKHRKGDIRRVFFVPELDASFREVAQWCERARVPYKVASSDELARVAATEHHEGVCFEARRHRRTSLAEVFKKKTPVSSRCIVVLEGVENPHNIGAIIRTLCFFGVTALVVVSSQGGVLSGAACRVAEGGAEVLPVVVEDDAVKVVTRLREEGFEIVATTPHKATSVYAKEWRRDVAILFGSEGSGLSTKLLELADERIVVPRVGPLESLNVGAAVASILTEVKRIR